MAKKTTEAESVSTVHDTIDDGNTVIDDFSDLFEADGDVPFRVELVRLEPEEWEGIRLRGFICELEPGTTYSSIKRKYGGGRYRVDKRNAETGRYLTRRQLEICPWIPKIDDPNVTEPKTALSLADQPKLDVAGVSVPIGQVEHIKELVLWMRAIRTLLPEPPDANTQLLGTLVELVKEKSAPASDPLELLTKLRGAVPEIFERSSSDGTNLYTLLQEAIRQTGSILAGGYRLQRTAKLLKGKPQPAGRIDSGKPEKEMEEDVSMPTQPTNTEDALMMMLGELIKAFRLDPPKESKRVVAMFDRMFRLSKDERAEVKEMREVGLDVAENQLADDFLEDASLREKFNAYYTEFFDLYTDPERDAL